MSQKNKKNNATVPEMEYEIFGEHKSREQIKAEEKARKEAERKALQEALRGEKSAADKAKFFGLGALFGGSITTPLIVMALFLALLVGVLALAFSASDHSERLNRDESNAA